MKKKTFEDSELMYSATARCKCGAGLAYPMDHDAAWKIGAWVCSHALKNEDANPEEHQSFPWSFYKVREETSVFNSGGHTTRPPGTVAKTVGKAKCPKCKHEWQSDPYSAWEGPGHWRPGDCPGCGYGVGGHGMHCSSDGPSIDSRYPDVVLAI